MSLTVGPQGFGDRSQADGAFRERLQSACQAALLYKDVAVLELKRIWLASRALIG